MKQPRTAKKDSWKKLGKEIALGKWVYGGPYNPNSFETTCPGCGFVLANGAAWKPKAHKHNCIFVRARALRAADRRK